VVNPAVRHELAVWADRHVWPGDRDRFIDWCTHRPPGWHPDHPNPLVDDHWAAFAEFAAHEDADR
jgi:hypothetical protein